MIRIFLILIFGTTMGCAQNNVKPKLVGGPCEGCEAVFEYEDRHLTAVDTLPDFEDSGERLKITGTVYQHDGKTPAKGIILYIYHTNQEGIYPTLGNETGWARRHGYIRGWVKTDLNGVYTFYTLKPASYPKRSIPAHIHVTLLEPNGKYYWIGSYLFHGDPLLTPRELNQDRPRGGSSGILKLKTEKGILTGHRDIILGMNIDNYNPN